MYNLASNPPAVFPFHFSGCSTLGESWSPALSDDKPDTTEGLNELADWKWPKRPVIFISDLHADTTAFDASLVASGGATLCKKKGYKLTSAGKDAVFVIGGDCLDKGPSNLELLRALKRFVKTGAKVKILAGNHDLRLFMGLKVIGEDKHVGSEHMFVRMGNKAIPLLKEVFDGYLANTNWQKGLPDDETCRALLFPRETWFDQFEHHAQGVMTPEGIQREIKKMATKVDTFEAKCMKYGMSLAMVYAAAKRCQALFFQAKGEFSWFFSSMQLAYKSGSFLFVHAGLDDEVSLQIRSGGVANVNKAFQRAINGDLFQFYFSALSSVFRTKYRKSDPVFSTMGAEAVKRKGIYAVVHGHVNHCHGQQISAQQGLLHIEGDITLDRNSRLKEGLKGIGFGATIVHPDEVVIGISADNPAAKVFSPKKAMWPQLTEYQHAS